jgi:hypothetical protein
MVWSTAKTHIWRFRITGKRSRQTTMGFVCFMSWSRFFERRTGDPSNKIGIPSSSVPPKSFYSTSVRFGSKRILIFTLAPMKCIRFMLTNMISNICSDKLHIFYLVCFSPSLLWVPGWELTVFVSDITNPVAALFSHVVSHYVFNLLFFSRPLLRCCAMFAHFLTDIPPSAELTEVDGDTFKELSSYVGLPSTLNELLASHVGDSLYSTWINRSVLERVPFPFRQLWTRMFL